MHQTLVGTDREAERKQFVAAMLYAVGTEWEGRNGIPAPYAINRRARLRLGIGLYDHYARTELDQTTPFRIAPGDYGPKVSGLDGSIGQLEDAGIVYVDEGEHRSYHLLRPSNGRDSFRNRSDGEQELLEWLVERHVSRDVGALLSFTYNKAGEFVSR